MCEEDGKIDRTGDCWCSMRHDRAAAQIEENIQARQKPTPDRESTCPELYSESTCTSLNISMPVASSSRRKVLSRRQPSSDQIEEEKFSQKFKQQDNVDDDDEEEQPRLTSKRVKKEKKPTKGKEKAQSIAEGQDGDGGGGMDVDYADFQDQPLIRGDAAKLKGLAQDWAQIRKGIHQPSFGQIREIAIAIADTAEGDENEKVSEAIIVRIVCRH
jgi:hypothetical protein